MNTAVATDPKVDALYKYVQERFLWQFYSREWDRKENINGITEQATRLLTGEAPLRETPEQRLQVVDAQVMVDDFKRLFPWFSEVQAEEARSLMARLREKLTDIAITKSKNHELSHTLY